MHHILYIFLPSEFTFSPQNVIVCDVQSIPTTFSLSCGFTAPVFPLWNVTGLAMGQIEVLSRGQSVDGYLSYPQSSVSIARLNVDLTSSRQVIEGTCFQCVLDLVGGAILSEKGCITVVGGLPACSLFLSEVIFTFSVMLGTSRCDVNRR